MAAPRSSLWRVAGTKLIRVTSLSTWLLVVIWLAVGAGAAVSARWAFHRLLAPEQLDGATAVAGPLMPALGAVFALLAALSLAGEAAATRSAQADVSLEAAAASRLAWSATTAGFDTEEVHRTLGTYLEATVANEWSSTDQQGDDATRAAVADLEVAVRDSAVTESVGSAPAGELLGALDSVTSLRRQRLAVADQALPDFYVAVVVVSGLALIVNSAAVAIRARRRAAVLTAGLVVVVSLAVALLFALAAPYQGGFVVDEAPLDQVIDDLQAGYFQA